MRDDATDIAKRVRRLERRGVLEAGVFLQDASSAGDKLTVTVPEFDGGEHAHGEPDGVVWNPRTDDGGDAVFPSAGDTAYVMEAGDGRWVVLAWTPA